MSRAQIVNLAWLGAVLGCVVAGWSTGLLALVVLLLMDIGLRLEDLATKVGTIAAVFDTEPDEITEERAEELTHAVMTRISDEMRAAGRRPRH